MFEIILHKQFQDDGDPEVTRYATAAEVYVELGKLAERFEKVVHIDHGLSQNRSNRYATVHDIGQNPVLSAIAVARWVVEEA